MTTPATVGGKAFLIAYGLFGCAGTILFFNLFLERIISLLAFIMRACRERQLRRSGLLPATFRRGSALSEADSLAGWKPSVYHVLLILGLFAVLLACCASAMYTSVEGWDYVDSLYFCFVTFSTIGFGDLVSSQHAAYRNQGLYRLGNFLFILLGVCCIYSLFNVISILIKQVTPVKGSLNPRGVTTHMLRIAGSPPVWKEKEDGGGGKDSEFGDKGLSLSFSLHPLCRMDGGHS
ncbi:potassium channel subfamily K member 12-like protein [Cricetulus griseus]|nr:potassium channel subfamily K member 12-like protein [Cricetulus griseus]